MEPRKGKSRLVLGLGDARAYFRGDKKVIAVGTMREVHAGPQARQSLGPAACHAPEDAGRAAGPTDPESQAHDEAAQTSGQSRAAGGGRLGAGAGGNGRSRWA